MTGVYLVVEEDIDYRQRTLKATAVLSTAWQVYRQAVNEEHSGVIVRLERWVEHAEQAQILVWHHTELRPTTAELRQWRRRRERDTARTNRVIDDLGEAIAHTHALLDELSTPF